MATDTAGRERAA